MTNETDAPERWTVNPETPSVIITPHGRISVSWTVQRPGEPNDFALAEETAAMIVAAVNAYTRTPSEAVAEVEGEHVADGVHEALWAADREVERLREALAAAKDLALHGKIGEMREQIVRTVNAALKEQS